MLAKHLVLTGVENMISTFSDVVESGGDIFVSLGLMPPAAAAAVNLSFDVAKWFVGLWKSLKVQFTVLVCNYLATAAEQRPTARY